MDTLPHDLDDFTWGYITCLLWTEETDQDDGRPQELFVEHLSDALIHQSIKDCEAFQKEAADLLTLAYNHPVETYDPEQAGHDFWLTRNGHGAGFWDRGLGEVGEKLTALCDWGTKYSRVDTYWNEPTGLECM